MKLATFLIVGSMFAWSSPSLADRPPRVSDPQPTAAAEKKICKTVGENLIGSRFGKSRVCKTAAQWERDLERQKTSSTNGGGKRAGRK